MIQLIALAASLLQQQAAKKRERQDLLNQQVNSINKMRAQELGANPYALAGIDNTVQWGHLNRAQREQGDSNIGTALQAMGSLGSDSSAKDGFSQAKAYAGGDVGGSGGISPGGHDFLGPTESSLDGDNLLKRLDDYGIDYGNLGRERLWG
jgi:hypothetical protein